MSVSGYTSAEPLVALLQEDDPEMKGLALETLNEHVHEFWSEVAPNVSYIEQLSENSSFPHHQTAAVVASKLYYHLGSFDDALRCALHSSTIKSTLSEKVHQDEYMQAILSQCIETYIAFQRGVYLHRSASIHKESMSLDDDTDDSVSSRRTVISIPPHPTPIDSRVGELVEYLVRLHVSQGHHNHSLGICIEAMRLDLLKEILIAADAKLAAQLMRETFMAAINTVDIPLFKRELLTLLVELYRTPPPSSSSPSTPSLSPAASTTTTTPIDGSNTLDSIRKQHAIAEDLHPSKETSLHVVSDILSMCQCLQVLGHADTLAEVLVELIDSPNQDDHLLAYQVAFDLCQYQHIAFTSRVAQLVCDDLTLASLGDHIPIPSINRASGSSTNTSPVPVIAPANLTMETSTTTTTATDTTTADTSTADDSDNTTTNTTLTPAALAPETTNVVADGSRQASPAITTTNPRVNLYRILTGQASAALHSHFLYTNARDNDDWYRQLFTRIDNRNGAVNSAFFTGYAIAQNGTHRDEFLRKNWMSADGTRQWAKFTNRASLGSIYRGQYEHIRDILAPFLPDADKITTSNSNTKASGTYSDGGALYALGLASCGVNSDEHLPYLHNVLQKAIIAKDEPLIHGSCLAIGLCGIGTGDEDIYDTLRSIIWEDQPVAGEGAGIAVGLLMVGLGSDPKKNLIVKELIAFARSCPHEKIVRGVGLALALMFFGLTQASEPVSAALRHDPSPLLRWAAVWIDAMAYCGTGDSTVVGRLLSLAVSDVNDDITRAAVIALGFIMVHEGEQLVDLLQQLSQSYSFSVRHGVALSIGVACAGAGGDSNAYRVIEPLLNDSSDVVRQSALISMSMILNQTNGKQYKSFRTTIDSVIRGNADSLERVGALYASGILNSGGMNSQIRLLNQFNQQRTIAICGMMLFCQFWYWYPLALCFSLTLSPTGVIAVDQTLRIPASLKLVAETSKRSMGYPVYDVAKVQEQKKKHIINKLSASRKLKRGGGQLASTALNRFGSFASDLLRSPSLNKTTSSLATGDMKDDEENDTDILLAGAPIDADTGYTKEQLEKIKEKQERAERRRIEREQRLPVHVLSNCSRVLPQFIDKVWCPKQRFVPVKTRLFNIILVRDANPNAGDFDTDILQFPSLTPGHDIDTNEPNAPEPFPLSNDMVDDDNNDTPTATTTTGDNDADQTSTDTPESSPPSSSSSSSSPTDQ